MLVTFRLSDERKKYYEQLAHEVVDEAVTRGDEEHATGEIDGISYEIDAEWHQTCCVTFYCPGDKELRGRVIFTYDGMDHYVDFSESEYMYNRSTSLIGGTK